MDYIDNDPIHRTEVSTILEEIWNLGMVKVGTVERGSAHYVTNYHLFPLVDKWQETDNREKPFAVMSKKPGIGANYIDEQTTNYYNRTKNSYATLKNGTKQPLGRYLKEKITEASANPDLTRQMQSKSAKYIMEEEERRRQTQYERFEGDIGEAEKYLAELQRDERKYRNKEVKSRLKNHGKL